jgi:hypothetical protein
VLSPAAFADKDAHKQGPVEVYCRTWTRNTHTQQCALYFTNVRHTRINSYYDGKWLVQDDFWPENVNPRSKVTER